MKKIDKSWKLIAITISLLVALLLTACGGVPLVLPEKAEVTAAASVKITKTPETTANAFTSPLITPTAGSAIKQAASTPIPPTPTFTPSPTIEPKTPTPSPTAKLLPPLDENLQTVVYTTQGEQGPEIWRVQVDEQGQSAETPELMTQMDLPTYIPIRIYGLYPSPDGQRLVIDWAWGTATHVHILDISNGQLSPLFGETDIDQRVTFLDWSPDGQNVLVMGGTANPDLSNSAWLVDVNTHQYRDVNIKQVNEIPRIYGASFSPDGKMTVYTHSHTNGEIWHLNLETSEQHLLYRTDAVITDVSWSPDGNYIAFTQLYQDENFPRDEFITGELHVMRTDGSEERVLSSIVIDYKDYRFRPVWSPDSQKIVFVKNESPEPGRKLEQFISNIYMIDARNNHLEPLTNYQDAKIINPTWKTDGSQIAFLISKRGSGDPFHLQKITINEHRISSLDVNPAIKPDTLDTYSGYFDTQSHIVWLP